MTEPNDAPQPDFITGDSQIGVGPGGLLTIAQRGQVLIAQGILTLFGTKENLIDSAPLHQVEIKRCKVSLGRGVFATLNGKKYYVSGGLTEAESELAVDGLTQGAMIKANTLKLIEVYERLTGKKV